MEEINLVKNSRYPFKRAGASFFNTSENTYILLGGGNRSEEFEDLWELKLVQTENQTQAQWDKVQLSSSEYTKRTGQSAIFLENQLYSFGGQNFHINKHFDDFLVCNISEEYKKLEKVIKNNPFGPKSILHQPGERNSSAMTCDKNQKIIYLHGGADPSEPLQDLYSFKIENQTWKKLNPECSELIKPVEMHTLHYYESKKDITRVNAEKNKKKKQKKKDKKKNNNAKLIDLGFGGGPQQQQQQQQQSSQTQESSNPEDTPEQIAKNITKINLEFDPSTVVKDSEDKEEYDQQALEQIKKFKKTEQQIQESEKQEESKQEEEEEKESNQDNNKEDEEEEEENLKQYLILTGGRYKEEILNTIFALDLNENKWQKLKELPFPICAHSSVILQEKNELWIFGGTDGQQFLDTLIIYNFVNGKLYQADLSTEANQSAQKIFFGPKMAPSMAVDSISKRVLIYGGSMYEDESSQLLSIDYTKINSSQRVKKI